MTAAGNDDYVTELFAGLAVGGELELYLATDLEAGGDGAGGLVGERVGRGGWGREADSLGGGGRVLDGEGERVQEAGLDAFEVNGGRVDGERWGRGWGRSC